MSNYYILVDATHPSLLDIRTACYRKNCQHSAGIMAERISHSAQEHFIKVVGANQAWFDAQGFAPEAIVFNFLQGDSIGDQVQAAWGLAQCPRFYPGGATEGEVLANNQERRDYWFNLWQELRQ